MAGFACDEGVRRNGGRIGAKEGPRAIRGALANLAWHQTGLVYDAGDLQCDDDGLEHAQAKLAGLVASAIQAGHRPLILGGGHETAWGTFQGVIAAKPQTAVGIINIDAHLDLRADVPGTSGTPFYQMAKWCEQQGQMFHYLCMGIAQPSNTAALFHRARELGASVVSDSNLQSMDLDAVGEVIDEFLDRVENVYLSVDLDVLPAAVMPAVSAPAARGIPLDVLETVLHRIFISNRVIAMDIVELNPAFDIDNHGARVAARLVYQSASIWE